MVSVADLVEDTDRPADVVVELTARQERVTLESGREIDGYTFNGQSPGPLIEATEGDLRRGARPQRQRRRRHQRALARRRRAQRRGRRRRRHPGRHRRGRGPRLPVRRRRPRHLLVPLPPGLPHPGASAGCSARSSSSTSSRRRRGRRPPRGDAHLRRHAHARRPGGRGHRGRAGRPGRAGAHRQHRQRRGPGLDLGRRTGCSRSTRATSTGRRRWRASGSRCRPAGGTTWRSPRPRASTSARPSLVVGDDPGAVPQPREQARHAVVRRAHGAAVRPRRGRSHVPLLHGPAPGLRRRQAGVLVVDQRTPVARRTRCTSSTRATSSSSRSRTTAARCTRCTCTATTPSCSRATASRRRGSPWWVDSLDVENGETMTVAFVADNPGIWMDHCHNLKHAARGARRPPDVQRRHRALPPRRRQRQRARVSPIRLRR